MKSLILLGALFASVSSASNMSPSRADANPALFSVADEDTTIYLLGTVHILDEDTVWFDDEVKTAFDASSELVIEMLEPSPAEMQSILLSKAIDTTGPTLSQTLKPETMARLTEEVAKGGISLSALEPMDPWFAALTLVQFQFQRAGLSPETGVEKILTSAAKASGKSVAGLEEFAWQIDLFDSLPEDQQVEFLEQGIADLADAETYISQLIEIWSAGDVDRLANLVNESLAQDDNLRARLLVNRNASWAEWIETRLKDPGTVFMAVGAGHLGGEDSVQDMLAERGLVVMRVED
ncbi:TraB/GumN family protein [Pacificimonas sp. WHA3]|uniref:TraB/GumN family protein n=1 Tax=Pacificimonas pallii TaxID=2827236 RepID=A0ABS6SD95_9SPHN|nr:TraB/GumN family protein [Pacificimonas pallii]MBV7256389.1 TraB/GumN family protein [Pacificimonas pallii]